MKLYAIIAILSLVLLAGCAGTNPPGEGKTAWISYPPIQCQGNPWEIWEAESGRVYIRSTTEQEIITSYYSEVYGVEVLDYKKRQVSEIVCLACSCPRGDRIFLEIYEKDIPEMVSLGWAESSKPKECPQIMPPAPNFCQNGTLIPGGFDSNGCQLPPTCGSNPDSISKQYISQDPEECKRIQFMCIPGKEPFYDETGCGCRDA